MLRTTIALVMSSTSFYYLLAVVLVTIVFLVAKKRWKKAIHKTLHKKVSEKHISAIVARAAYLGRLIYILLLVNLIGSIESVAQIRTPIVRYSLFSTDTIRITLWSVMKGIIVWHVLSQVLKLGRYTVRSYVHYDDDIHTIEILIYNTALIIIAFLAIGTVGINRKILIPLAWAIGIGVGFGLQDLLKNIISWLTVMFSRSVKTGDWVTVDEYYGKVSEIGLRVSVLKTLDNIEILVPNAMWVSQKIINRSYNDSKVRITLPVSVAYNSDVDLVRKVLLEVADSAEHVLKDPSPDVIFMWFGDSALQFELRVWMNVKKHTIPPFKSDINFAIRRAFKTNHIQIPFPQQDIRFRNELIVNEGTKQTS